MRQAGNWLVIGGSGSGKTHYLGDVIREIYPLEKPAERRAQYLVVINSTSQLSELCNHKEYVPLEKLKLSYSISKLAELIKAHGSVHFEIAPGDAEAFLDALGQAIFSLGVMDTTQCVCLVVLEEARHWVKKNAMPGGLERCEAEGRKFGIDIIKATQRLGSTGNDTIDLAAVNQITRLVVFPLVELNQRKRVVSMFGEIPDPSDLQRPDPARGWGGEYIVWDCLRGVGIRVRRNPDGSRYVVNIPEGVKA